MLMFGAWRMLMRKAPSRAPSHPCFIEQLRGALRAARYAERRRYARQNAKRARTAPRHTDFHAPARTATICREIRCRRSLLVYIAGAYADGIAMKTSDVPAR